jgi:hypothetical protein
LDCPTTVSRILFLCVGIIGFGLCQGGVWAQSPAGTAVPPRNDSYVSVPAAGSDGLPARNLAPGVLTVIDPDQNAEDTAIGPADLEFVAKHPELAWSQPNFENGSPNFASPSETLVEMGKNVTLRHPVWGLEFAFKPVRMIEANIPTKSGAVERKLVWYLIYRLRYVGGDLHPELEDVVAGSGVAKPPMASFSKYVRFLPRFTFVNTQTKTEKSSQILSTVIPAIEARERVGKPVYDEVKISRQEIKPSVGDQDFPLWGVATWTDIPADTDYFAIQIRGLTNAYKISKSEAGQAQYLRKTLQLYFWRPGDTIAPTEDRIRLGVPPYVQEDAKNHAMQQFGVKKRLDYEWLYR